MPRLVRAAPARWIVTADKMRLMNASKTLSFKSKKLSDGSFHVTHVSNGGQWIDAAAAVAGMVFPELAPFIGPAKTILKHFTEDKKEKHQRHEPRVERHNMPSVTRVPTGVAVQRNLVAAMRQNVRPVQSATSPVRFAPMPTRLNVGDVPVLHGQTGHMPQLPVTVQRTESHATMSGSEYLGTLQLDASQNSIGLNVYNINFNPRSFPGTKLTAEAITWQMYRARRIVVEYIPIQGSATTGSFIGYFVNDPFEDDVGGIQAVRNAVEHENSLMFQPFFHSIMAYTDDGTPDKHLYFCTNEPDSDPRFEIQTVFKIVQNVVNTAGVPFGSLMVHYEYDFYHPETTNIVPGSTAAWPTAWTGDPAPAAQVPVGVSGTGATTENKGKVLSAICTSLPANGSLAVFAMITPSDGLYIGRTVYLKPQGTINGLWNIYSSLAAADIGDNYGRLCYQASLPAASAPYGFTVIGVVAGATLAAVRQAGSGLTTHPQDETQTTTPHDSDSESDEEPSIPLSKLASYQFMPSHLPPPSTPVKALTDIEDLVGPPKSKRSR